MKYYLAIDIGASSGRGIIGYKEDGKLKTNEVFRFPNSVKKENGCLIWDIDKIYENVLLTIKEALTKYPLIESMSIDTWGVDYVLIDNENKPIYPCYAYRDNRTKQIIDEVHNIIDFDNLYKITGTQFQEFNTIYQLYKDKKDGRLKEIKTFLQIPCYLIYKLTGIMVHEYTNASTTGLLDGDTLDYSDEIISKLGFDKNIFYKLCKPGEKIGFFKDEIAAKVGGNIKVVLCSTHDTASAVEGTSINDNTIYISSGTWSLLGIKTDKTIRTKQSQDANYSNEYGKDYIRFQKNIMGLWIAQCLNKELNISFNEMSSGAEKSTYNQIFNVNDNRFLSSFDMKEKIVKYFEENNTQLPENNNDIFRTVYRSLAYSYNEAIKELEAITNKHYDTICIVGGGAKNNFLNDEVKKATGKNVIALPIEATSIGNLLTQMENENEKRNL